MRITICAVGRMRTGPERTLFDDYAARFDRTGRQLGLGPLTLREVEDKKGGGMSGEAALLRGATTGALAVCLDERGTQLTSPGFAQKLTAWRDQGTSDVAFLIGGADGIAPDLRAETRLQISLGKMVWPHMLARVMLAEQLYRAASIIAGNPYHRA